jgi:hypothetical protein
MIGRLSWLKFSSRKFPLERIGCRTFPLTRKDPVPVHNDSDSNFFHEAKGMEKERERKENDGSRTPGVSY